MARPSPKHSRKWGCNMEAIYSLCPLLRTMSDNRLDAALDRMVLAHAMNILPEVDDSSSLEIAVKYLQSLVPMGYFSKR